jgi:biopolymer transport protein ExbD
MGGKRRRAPRLELTPLMDVMFLVLVFFIYCICEMSLHRGLKVELPSAAGAKERGECIVVTILSDDRLQLNGIELDRDELLARVTALREADVKLPIIISGDRKASLGAGIELLEKLKKLGIEKISFQVSGERRSDGQR